MGNSSNRHGNPDRTGNRAITACDIAAEGTVVHLEGFGLVKAFRIATPDGGTEHGLTNDLDMSAGARVMYAERAWGDRGVPSRVEAAHGGGPVSDPAGDGAAE